MFQIRSGFCRRINFSVLEVLFGGTGSNGSIGSIGGIGSIGDSFIGEEEEAAEEEEVNGP